jgi:hypothetical protein
MPKKAFASSLPGTSAVVRVGKPPNRHVLTVVIQGFAGRTQLDWQKERRVAGTLRTSCQRTRPQETDGAHCRD